MRCLISAGPTWEPLDRVRRLTNFSTGSLGGELANFLAGQGHDVALLLGETATWRASLAAVSVRHFSTTASLQQRFAELAGWQPEIVFHAAAVSDFTGGSAHARGTDGALTTVTAGKLSTREGSLLIELRPTPKLLTELPRLFVGAKIVGWKFEVDGTADDAVAAGQRQLRESGTFACVVNGPAYGPGFGILRPDGQLTRLPDRSSLFEELAGLCR